MEFHVYSVGEKVCSPGLDEILFDMNDGGGLLIIKFGNPTAKEKRAFKDHISFRFVVVDGIIMVLVRLGMMQWMDAPYYRYKSPYLTKVDFPEDGEGLAIHALLIDADTGVLVAQKLFSPDTDTSRAFITAVKLQEKMPDCDARLARIMATYRTTDLVNIWERQNNLKK